MAITVVIENLLLYSEHKDLSFASLQPI